MIAGGLFDVQPKGWIEQNVTSKEHRDLTRDLAERSAVLLKNEHSLLPLDCTTLKSVAMLGKPGHSKVITGGDGSGHVNPTHVVSPLDGVTSFLEACGNHDVNVTYYDGKDVAHAEQLASEVDLVITVLATSSGEGTDRKNLDLPSDELDLAKAAASGNPDKSVALVISPGPALMPFADSTAAVMLMFMPGQEEGSAFANLIFGASNPSGRLPITIPNKENEVGFTQKQYPGLNDATEVEYTEKLEVGYRWYNAHGVTPHFAFGHGVTYTDFAYSDLSVHGNKVSIKLSNSGSRDGVEVVQLYLDYPAGSGEPPLQLRGYKRIAVKAGQAEKVEFDLVDKSFSIWDVDSHAFQVVPGSFTLSIGASSQDIRLTGKLEVAEHSATFV
jgi:beta-glucosidase